MASDSAIRQPRISLTAFQIKLFALGCMLIDHIGAFLLDEDRFRWAITCYPICRSIGRLAFPIFCCFIAEGAAHTRSLPKYAARLGLFALISTPPFNLVHGAPWYATYQLNVFFTLLAGLGAVCCIKELAPRIFRRLDCSKAAASPAACTLLALPFVAGLYWAAYALHTDYGGYGVAAIVLFWLLREKPLAAWGSFAVLTYICWGMGLWQTDPWGVKHFVAMNPYALLTNAHPEWRTEFFLTHARQNLAPLAGLLWLGYRGEKGGERMGKAGKYLFYAFYPVHLMLLWIAELLLFGA